MKLIKKLNTRRAKNGEMRRWGLFLCEYCNKKVEKEYFHGLKNESCGCAHFKLIGENQKIHGCACRGRQTRLYNIWNHAEQRCNNVNDKAYKNYGGRGITICKEWLEFIPFKEWALNNGYKDNLTIDRRDNDGNYEPSNCRWTTRIEQNRNSRSAKLNMREAKEIRRLYFVKGMEPKILVKKFDVSRRAIWSVISSKTWA